MKAKPKRNVGYVHNPGRPLEFVEGGRKKTESMSKRKTSTTRTSAARRAGRKRNPSNVVSARSTAGRSNFRINPPKGTASLLVNGAVGAAGAAVIGFGVGMLPMPEKPIVKAGVKIGAGVGTSMLGGKIIGQQYADIIGVALVTLGCYDLAQMYFPKLGKKLKVKRVKREALPVAANGEIIATPAQLAGYEYLPDANLSDIVYVDESALSDISNINELEDDDVLFIEEPEYA